MPIKLTDAAKYYKALAHQRAAFDYLQEILTDRELERFAQLYRTPAEPAAISTTMIQDEFTWQHPITGTIVNRILRLNMPLKRGLAYIVGIEGVNTDLTPNADELDGWNDVAGALTIDSNGLCRFVGPFKCTTEPGKYYTINPMNPKGGGRVLTDSFNKECWQIGTHIRQQNCMIQAGNPLTVTRDSNKDGKRGRNELVETTRWSGFNFHHANDRYNALSVGRWSAGCLVIPAKAQHQKVVNYAKNFNRNQTRYTYILLDGSKLRK